VKLSYLGGMDVREFIRKREGEFVALCKSHDVSFLYAFGSATGPHFNDQTSDIDLLVELNTSDPIEKGKNLLDLWDRFEAFFQRKVDLVTWAQLRNPILRRNIDASKVLVYDGTES